MSYEGMSELGKTFAGQPFQILAFPCNQFNHQEPKSNSWIKNFVKGSTTNHKCGLVYCDWKGTFPYPMFAKANVKPDWCTADPSTSCTASSTECCSKNDAVWKWLANDIVNKDYPSWNFAGKHLFDKCGNHQMYVNDATYNPTKLTPYIQSLLSKDC
eukprot:m.31324 g.31324  ORF g.31324 m.31324 type:complete len:157 (-) comp9694_c0_seq1:771-1241(-)